MPFFVRVRKVRRLTDDSIGVIEKAGARWVRFAHLKRGGQVRTGSDISGQVRTGSDEPSGFVVDRSGQFRTRRWVRCAGERGVAAEGE